MGDGGQGLDCAIVGLEITAAASPIDDAMKSRRPMESMSFEIIARFQ
jgi:hypothetical protein